MEYMTLLSTVLMLQYAVTEKVWESESTDDSEPEAKPQTRGEKKGPAKPVQTSPPKATKQSLLSSFFKNK